MSRVYNFSAGPSMLPEEVLKKAQDEMVEYGQAGMSVMEMSHRSKDYEAIINGCEALVRELMNVPDNYRVLNCIALGQKGEFKKEYYEEELNIENIHHEFF